MGRPVAQGGVLSEYVPFYFGPRSPMLYTISRGNTEYGRTGRAQSGMLHLVCHLERLVRDHPGRWCFIDAHLTRAWAEFGDTLDELDDRVDFDVMAAQFWNAPDEVTAARQAEFLIHRVVPWLYVEFIVVMSDAIAQEVEDVLASSRSAHVPEVHVRPPGHYRGSPFPHGYYY